MLREHPSAQNVTHGLPDDALGGLDDRTKRLLIRLMARVAESAYRRGAQQGAHIALTRPNDLPRKLANWRFCPSTDISPGLDDPAMRPPSNERLFMENPGLRRLGLPDPELDPNRTADRPK